MASGFACNVNWKNVCVLKEERDLGVKICLASMTFYWPIGIGASFSMARAYGDRILNLFIIKSSSSLALGNLQEDAQFF